MRIDEQSERWQFHYWSAYLAAAIVSLREEGRKVSFRLALKFVVQSYANFVDVLLL